MCFDKRWPPDRGDSREVVRRRNFKYGTGPTSSNSFEFACLSFRPGYDCSRVRVPTNDAVSVIRITPGNAGDVYGDRVFRARLIVAVSLATFYLNCFALLLLVVGSLSLVTCG